MAIDFSNLINKLSAQRAASPVQGNHTSLIELQKEQDQQKSIFAAQELASLTNESVYSNAIQNVILSHDGVTDVQELMCLYLNSTGKAANAQSKDANGNMQSVNVSELSLDEMKAVAQGVSNPLAGRDASKSNQLGSFGITKASW